MKKIWFLMALVLASGCTRVKQGELGIVSHFSGTVSDEAAHPGFNMTIFDSIETVDATEVRVPMTGLTPKDKDGVLVTAAVTATYRINTEKAVAFFKQTHEVDQVKENESTITVLGYRVLEQETNNATQKAFSEFAVSEIVPRKMEMEKRLKELLQQKIDARYADAFIIVNVNINETRLGEAVELVLQSQAIAKSQKQLLELQKDLSEQETALLNKKFEGMKKVAGAAGIPVDKVMEYKLREQYNNVLSEMAKNHSNTQVQVK
jgi:hypothetical protein